MGEKSRATDHEILCDFLPDTGEIQIVPRYDDVITHPNCLVVDPYRDTERGTAIMASVEHYLESKDATEFPWRIVLVTEEPLVLKAAVEAALEYAKDYKVPVIFLNQGGVSAEAEERQTGTTEILRLPRPGDSLPKPT